MAILVLVGTRHRKEDKWETQCPGKSLTARGKSPDIASMVKSDHIIIFHMVPTKESVDIFGSEFGKTCHVKIQNQWSQRDGTHERNKHRAIIGEYRLCLSVCIF